MVSIDLALIVDKKKKYTQKEQNNRLYNRKDRMRFGFLMRKRKKNIKSCKKNES